MKLYDSRRAPNPRRVRWFMAEKGIEDVEIVEVDIFAGQHRTPDYMARAGLPNVPALEMDDGTTITESVAICRYLESVYPEPNLFGVDPREVAIIEMWARRAEMLVATPLMLTVRHSHPALAAIETQIPEVAASNRAAAEKGIKVLDRRLGETPFIAGDRVTIADILAVTGIDFARMARFRPDPELVNVKRWLEEMNARPAAKAGV
ncbi:glutathione S-transferase family protein [Caulobacter endophyticus]|uniref:glutathione S-transferase family protein n=1 Tax=Caulobacter endophyticus TaxID=2172652 RepID=UPI00240EFB35|nr:glutathione S-transferase [Caulobacter endophyticus]MDG2531723.1 glutathione S-transferase [Caulobacter endophyticus]